MRSKKEQEKAARQDMRRLDAEMKKRHCALDYSEEAQEEAASRARETALKLNHPEWLTVPPLAS